MTDPRQTADPEICAQWDWCPYCKNGLDTGLQCDQCLADLMPVQEALRELQCLRREVDGWRKGFPNEWAALNASGSPPGAGTNHQDPGTPGDERRLAVGAARVEGVGATASLPEPPGADSSYRRMFEAACSSLGEIAKEAGVPEEHADDGPEAILDAIRALKQRVSPEVLELRRLQAATNEALIAEQLNTERLSQQLTARDELLRDIKNVFAGDAAPHWVNECETTLMRGHFLDRIDGVLT